MQFNESLLKTGVLQSVEVKLFGDNGYGKITEDTSRLYQFTDRCNRALDRFNQLAMPADGRWKWEDSNYDDQSVATTDVVSGQREYELASDHLEIEKVLIKNSSGLWDTIYPIDQTDIGADTYLENNSGRVGLPLSYDKRGTTLYLDVTPNYNSDEGLKVYFRRGPSYFIYSDTTKSPGIPSLFHPFIATYVAAKYAIDRTMTNKNDLIAELQKEEDTIVQYFSNRSKDESKRIKTINTNSR